MLPEADLSSTLKRIKELQSLPVPAIAKPMDLPLLLLDIGNTHTHLGLTLAGGVGKQADIKTAAWFDDDARHAIAKFAGKAGLAGAALCSVVPRTTPLALGIVKQLFGITCLELTPKTLNGLGIDYPLPNTIGPDRLANAVAARHHFGAPVVVLDFGTAVTFDVVDKKGNYIGGIIAPGLAAMTDYLHDKTALLPRIKIREIEHVIGRSTREAMLAGAVHGYRGLIRELLRELKRELRAPRLPVVATGGYARLLRGAPPGNHRRRSQTHPRRLAVGLGKPPGRVASRTLSGLSRWATQLRQAHGGRACQAEWRGPTYYRSATHNLGQGTEVRVARRPKPEPIVSSLGGGYSTEHPANS